ncbi:RNA helicase [Trifolium repens]|nr:RNA helicase [Trifolium repens]
MGFEQHTFVSNYKVIFSPKRKSGKTVAFALPILQRLAEHPFGVFALVLMPTHELAFQLDEQFRALGSSFHPRTTVEQAIELLARPHIVIATPGRIKALLEDNQIARVFFSSKVNGHDEFVSSNHIIQIF